MSKEAEKIEEKIDQSVEKDLFDETMSALDNFLKHTLREAGRFDTLFSNRVLPDAMYIEKSADEEWKYVQNSESKRVRYEIVETGRPNESFPYPYDFPFQVRKWYKVDTNQWAYAGEGIFCKTLEQAHDYINTQEKEITHDSTAKISKSDENIREVQQKNGKVKLFCKKNDMWWPASKNDKGEVYPNLVAVSNNHIFLHNRLKKMFVNLERSGEKEIDFSNWSFTDIRFNEKSISELMKFANKINFKNAYLCYGYFGPGKLRNVNFFGATFDMYGIVKCTCLNCNFSNTVWEDPAIGKGNLIENSTFVGCKFKKAQFKNTEMSNNKFMELDMYIASNMLNKVRTSVLNRLKENQQKVKSRDTDSDAKQHDYMREER